LSGSTSAADLSFECARNSFARILLRVPVASAVRVQRQYGLWAMTGKTPGADHQVESATSKGRKPWQDRRALTKQDNKVRVSVSPSCAWFSCPFVNR
jgi:hypothetical protein